MLQKWINWFANLTADKRTTVPKANESNYPESYPEWIKDFQNLGIDRLPTETIKAGFFDEDVLGVRPILFFVWLILTNFDRSEESARLIVQHLQQQGMAHVITNLELNPEIYGPLRAPWLSHAKNPFNNLGYVKPYVEFSWAIYRRVYQLSLSCAQLIARTLEIQLGQDHYRSTPTIWESDWKAIMSEFNWTKINFQEAYEHWKASN
jgi:hypothetical protein